MGEALHGSNGTHRPRIEVCSDCDGLSRRSFLRSVSGAIAAGAVGSSLAPTLLGAAAPEKKPAETVVKAFYDTLKPEQKKIMCFPFDHELRSHVANNWHVVDPAVGGVGKLYSSDQQELVRQILQGVTSEDGYERFKKQMQDDAGGLDHYACAIFGEPGSPKFEFVLTGRHMTIRADGDSIEGTAFGGPMFYGHAVAGEEQPDHPGNVWWNQARLANDIYKALDGKQQKLALLESSPPDEASSTAIRAPGAEIPGLACSELSADQKGLVEKTLKSMLSMYRESDVNEALAFLKEGGGIDALRLSFYKEGDLGADGIWDRWRLESPRFSWYFRGSPHVHAWVNVGKPAKRARL